ECVRVLAEELGVPPLAETTELAEAIKENRVAARSPSPSDSRITGPESLARPPPAHAPHEPGPLRLPLVGRAAEWATLVGAYEAAREGGGRLVVLEGEAGIGKTRLAEDFLAQVRSGGAGVVAARCYEGESGLAYGPFAEGLRAALAHPVAGAAARLASLPDYWPGEAARLVPELGAPRPGAAPAAPLENTPGAQVRFLEGVSQVLAALVGAGGILFLDDAHWADQASLDLLTYLVRRLHTRPLYVLVTWRGEQVPPDHRLRRLLADARRAGTATAVSLSRLTAPEVAELVRAASAAGAELPQGLGGALYQETEGLPFFLVEYLRQVLAKGEPLAGRPLPRGVRELLRARLAEVSETGAQLLTTAAVVGRSFGFEIVRDASGRGDDEAVAALEELLARGLVRELESAGGGRLAFDFAHDRLRELVYEETSLARRRLLHRRVAEALRGRARGPWDVGAVAAQVAHHYRRAGQAADAAEYFRLAGEHARGLYANAEALAHFGAALALGHPDTAALHEMIGDLQTLAGAYAAARASYEHAAALAGEAAPRRVAALEHKLGELYRRRGEWDLAESHFEAARAALGEEEGAAGDRARLAADWSLVAHRQGEPGRALVLARRALDLAEAADDPRALAQVHNLLGILAGGRGEPELAGQHLERSLALADRLGDPSIRAAVLNNMALAHGRGGDLPRALELAEAALALCAAQGDRHREAALHNNLADLLHAAGRTAEAMTHLKQAVSIFAEIGWGGAGAAPSPEVWKLTEW
ncbi:MAG TPA: AAA family ATPase, partial [Chloroflexota bacterium]